MEWSLVMASVALVSYVLITVTVLSGSTLYDRSSAVDIETQGTTRKNKISGYQNLTNLTNLTNYKISLLRSDSYIFIYTMNR